jgi:hypothetical protein
VSVVERVRRNSLSVGRCTMRDMRIRTVDGPPLPHEIARDTVRAILLAHMTCTGAAEAEQREHSTFDPAADDGLLP